jgi:uncharacterized membrane-anchored protein YhcB (DUF1043 family)
MVQILAEGGPTDWSALAAGIAGIAAIIGVVVATRQFRNSAQDQTHLEREVAELERARSRALAEAVKQATAEMDQAESRDRRGPSGTLVAPSTGTTTPVQRVLADETQFEIVRKYHAQGLAQSRASFWFSLGFASLGFFIIATAVLTIDRNADLSQQSAAVISLLAGTIIDAVAGLFFVQSGRAQRVMQEFFEKLRTDRRLEESLTLVDHITDPELQGKLQVLLSLNFADVKPSNEILSAVLSLPGSHPTQSTKPSTADKP